MPALVGYNFVAVSVFHMLPHACCDPRTLLCPSQILMSVLLLVITTVTLMLPVPTLVVASPVPVTRDTLEMESYVWVSKGVQSMSSIPLLGCFFSGVAFSG